MAIAVSVMVSDIERMALCAAEIFNRWFGDGESHE